MNGTLLTAIILLSFLVFFIPKSWKYYYTLALLASAVTLTFLWCFRVLAGGGQPFETHIGLPVIMNGLPLTADKLSAFFILVINITVFTGLLYARGYLKPSYQSKNALRFSIHYFSYLWLYFSMLMVVMLRDGLSFLVAWEIMALSSFFLVVFDAEERSILKTGISYLIQMHAGMFFLLIAFLLVDRATGTMSFDSLGSYFSGRPDFPLFLLFFTGFAVKAGFIPLHTWLPEAHPAAPSHVSGVMSGVMIKMGIYGILRVLASVQDDLLLTGVVILIVSVISGVMGVMMASVQHDLKRLLAYHSIENIGIIGIGIGLGTIGLATDNNTLALLGYSGGLLHILNHSLFKSLLFFNAGSVYRATHTRNIEHMGGLMKKMPYTSVLFLTGSLAICGLPPFNGFISEFLIYMGMFKSLPSANLFQAILILGTIVSLSLIGGLAIFCFTKAFGIAFLGEPRSDEARSASEAGREMIWPQYMTVAFILAIGLGPALFVKPLFDVVIPVYGITDVAVTAGTFAENLARVSILGGVFILLVIALLLYRQLHLRRRDVQDRPTWGCGYTAGTARQQYTATSFAYNYNHIAKPLLQGKKIMEDISPNEIFPRKRSFTSHNDDIFRKLLIDKPIDWVSGILKKIAVMQTGQIQHYILYAFVFMLLIFLLTILNII